MRWMQLSDLHFGYDATIAQKMRRNLLEKAKSLGKIEALFITGDLRYAKNCLSGYPKEILDFVRNLQNALHVQPSDTFVVPGNHDVTRSTVLAAVVNDALTRYATPDGKIDAETLRTIQRQRKDYRSLYRKICGRWEPPGWHYCLQKGGFNIICLNTALFCCQDGEEGNLIVGSDLLLQLSEQVDASRPSIVLAHHDFDALRLEERENLENELKRMGAVLYLCGHTHLTAVHSQNVRNMAKNLQVFVCGANMDKSPGLSSPDMSFFVGETDNFGRQGFVQAYKWEDRACDWIPDPVFSHPQNGASDGRWYFPPETRPAQAMTPDETVMEKYRRYIRAQCGKIELAGLPETREDVERLNQLKRIFVPLSFRRARNRKDSAALSDSLRESEGERDSFGLKQLIPEQGIVRAFLLSDPGGGKSTLLKWISLAYGMPDEYRGEETYLTDRPFFPILLRCREIATARSLTIPDLLEWLSRQCAAGDANDAQKFSRLFQYHLKNGTALLLVDGLDEMGANEERAAFVSCLEYFGEQNPNVSILATSRFTGFYEVTSGSFADYARYEISPLDGDGIRTLCHKWQELTNGDDPESGERAERLADTILANERILRLAEKPLTLTALLMVERKYGSLPQKRSYLYEEASELLLERWNPAGHREQHMDLEETRYQLAYIAFQMMANHTRQLCKSELLAIIRQFRKERSDLVSGSSISPSEFVQRVEARSAALIQKGVQLSENGNIEPVYEFQHLTFQEYFAAYAVRYECYPGYEEDDRPGQPLLEYLTDSSMEEVIALSCVKPSCAKFLAKEMIARFQENSLLWEERRQLQFLMLQLLADEANLNEDTVRTMLAMALPDGLAWLKLLGLIANGRYADKLRNQCIALDYVRVGNWEFDILLFYILSGEIANPVQYYEEYHNSDSLIMKVRAFSALHMLMWLLLKGSNSYNGFRRWVDASFLELLRSAREELLILFDNPDISLKQVILYYLGCIRDYENELIDFRDYLLAFIRYANNAKEIPCNTLAYAAEIYENHAAIDCAIPLHSDAVRVMVEKFRRDEYLFRDDYEELLTLGLLAAVSHAEPEMTAQVFSLITEIQRQMYSKTPPEWDAMSLHFKLSQILRNAILRNPCYSAEEKAAVQEFILRTDLTSARYGQRYGLYDIMEMGHEVVFTYVDNSDSNETPYSLDYTHSTLAEVIAYMTERMERLGFAVPEDDCDIAKRGTGA